MNNNLRTTSILLLLLGSLLFNGFFLLERFTQTDTKEPGVIVLGVIDGDTIVIDQKTRVRLRHIDAPEENLCGYRKARETLEKLVVGKKVVVKELVPDQYGRGMGLVYVDGVLINQVMLESGWARYHSDKTSETDNLKRVVQEAKDEKRGVYGECQSLVNTKNPKCTIKGNIDKNSAKNNRKYYLPNCAQYQFTLVEEDLGEGWFCTEKEAQSAGFVKAETCKK
jgi:endonuclease YncB( thermonuclease family)